LLGKQGYWSYVGGIRRNRARDIGEWESGDNGHMFVGIDLHKSTFNAAVVDDDGNLLGETKGRCEPDELRRFSESLPKGSTVTMESSSTWYWAYRVLSQRHNVVPSNPVKTKAIASAKVKTDRVDAYTLADLSRGGYIAESYIPPPGSWGSGSGSWLDTGPGSS